MNKIFAIALAVTLGISNANANVMTVTPSNIHSFNQVWAVNLNMPNLAAGYQSALSGVMKLRILVNPSVETHGQTFKADRVSLSCNGLISYLTPGVWTDCKVQPNSVVEAEITKADFHNGAEVFFDMPD